MEGDDFGTLELGDFFFQSGRKLMDHGCVFFFGLQMSIVGGIDSLKMSYL